MRADQVASFRQSCLEHALRAPIVHNRADEIVATAKAFEAYVLGDEKVPPAHFQETAVLFDKQAPEAL